MPAHKRSHKTVRQARNTRVGLEPFRAFTVSIMLSRFAASTIAACVTATRTTATADTSGSLQRVSRFTIMAGSIFCPELAAPSEGTPLRALPCGSLKPWLGGRLLQVLLNFQPNSLDSLLALLEQRAELELQFRMLLD